jgi:sugar O-acyltransferase (sialic acid O-acetyltransferase NeuD family)
MLPVVVIGAGGHARVVIAALLIAKRNVLGCTGLAVPETDPGVPFLGNDESLANQGPSRIELANGLGSVGRVTHRRATFEALKRQGYEFVTIVHSAAIVMKDAVLGEGVQIMAGAIVQPGCLVSDNVLINTGAIVDHDCRIGAHSHIATGARLSGGVQVELEAHIGAGATVVQGCRIGRGAVVGAGAVVIRDVAANEVVVGVPARAISRSGGRL